MNIIKIFALSIIFSSISSINAMNTPVIEAIDVSNLNLSPAEKPYFECLKEIVSQNSVTLYFAPEIQFKNYIPANIEFNNKEMASYFNVMSTVVLFAYVIKNPNEKEIIKKMDILPISLYNDIQNDFSHLFFDILTVAYSEIRNLKLTHTQRDNICGKIQNNINKIIYKIMNNNQ